MYCGPCRTPKRRLTNGSGYCGRAGGWRSSTVRNTTRRPRRHSAKMPAPAPNTPRSAISCRFTAGVPARRSRRCSKRMGWSAWRATRCSIWSPRRPGAWSKRAENRGRVSATSSGEMSRAKERTMSYEHILVDIEDGVGIITLNRPEKLNAMNRRLAGEVHEAVQRLDADDAVGCIVLTGAGRAFSAGGDIHEQLEDDARYSDDELNRMRTRRGYLDISMSKKPNIGMMNGLAFGGAAVIASSLDIRIGCEDSKFRFLAAAYGRINSTWTLPNQVGWPIAKELLFTGRIVEADEAQRIGLLNHLVPCAQLREKTLELGAMIAKNRRGSVMGVKALLLQHMGKNLEEQWANERDYTTNVMRGAKAEDAFPEFIARKGR